MTLAQLVARVSIKLRLLFKEWGLGKGFSFAYARPFVNGSFEKNLPVSPKMNWSRSVASLHTVSM